MKSELVNVNRDRWPTLSLQGRRFRRRARRGSVLVEFALVVLVLYFIIAAILTFGRAIFVAQVLQQSADTFARELSRTPLPPGETMTQLFRPDDGTLTAEESAVRRTLFDERALRIDISAWMANDGGLTLSQYLEQQQVPLINRMLSPVMVIDQAGGATYLWYPGVTTDPTTGRAVVQVLRGDGTGAPTRVPVLEPAGSPDPFPLTNPDPSNDAVTLATGGLAAVRLNYPFQSESLSAVTYTMDSAGKTTNNWIDTGEPPDVDSSGARLRRGGLYAGPSQLGQQIVGGRNVRPFQRLISAQGVYRREVFAAPATDENP